MRENIHPEYNEVIFQDSTTDTVFLTRSTIKTNQTMEYNGKTYPVVKLEVTSASHSYYTGKKSAVLATGQVEKFNKRFLKK